MEPHRAFGDLKFERAVGDAIVVADLPLLLDAQDLAELDAGNGREGRAFAGRVNREARVVGRKINLADEGAGRLDRGDSGEPEGLCGISWKLRDDRRAASLSLFSSASCCAAAGSIRCSGGETNRLAPPTGPREAKERATKARMTRRTVFRWAQENPRTRCGLGCEASRRADQGEATRRTAPRRCRR